MRSLTSFVGRDEELGELVGLVERCRLVTIIGPGGIGKTRLASEAVAASGARFSGGVRRCDLATVEAGGDAASALGAQLGLPTIEAAAVNLGDDHTLVVVDSCEHVVEGAAHVVADLLAQVPTLQVLATSRMPLGVAGEHVLVLGPLGLPDEQAAGLDVDRVLEAPGVRLYIERARAAGATVDAAPDAAATVARLCRRLGGIPLAIELAAARARTLGPADLLAQLEHRVDVVSRPRPGIGTDSRHDSLREVMEASSALLGEREASLFRRLAVFGGVFDADLAHDVRALPKGDHLETLDLLAALVDRSLVVAEQHGGRVRYRLLDSLRQHAAERLDAAGERATATEAFVARMVHEATAIVDEALRRWSPAIVRRVADQFHNLVSALDHCVALDETPDRAHVLLLPLWGAVHQALFHEVAAVGARVAARWPERGRPGRPEAMAVVSSAALACGDLDQAAALASDAASDPATSAFAGMLAHRTLGFVCRARGDLDAAAAHFRRAAQAIGEVAPAFARELAVCEAAATGSAGDTSAALAVLQPLADDAAATGEAMHEARARLVAAALLLRDGRVEEAAAEVIRAQTAAEGTGQPWAVGAAARLQAVIAALDDWDRSLPLWRRALDDFASTGDVREVGFTLRDAAGAAARTGRRELAVDLLALAPNEVAVTILPPLFSDELAALVAELPWPPPAPAVGLRRARQLLAASVPPESPRPPPTRAGVAEPLVLTRTGDVWQVAHGGRTVVIRHLKGIGDLAALVAQPDREIHCLTLMNGLDVGGDVGPAIDDRARRAYRDRIVELQQEVDDATLANDLARSARAEAELDALVEQLSQAFGLGGRARAAGSAAERARSAVTWRIRAAVRAVTEVDPEIGRYLSRSIRTGIWCCYRPDD